MKKRSVLLVFFFFILMQGKAQVFSKVLYDSVAEGSLNGCFIDEDGGYVFEGFFSPPSDYDYFIMKTTTTGQPVWMKRSLSNSGPFLKSGIKTHDGGFAFVGEGIEPYYITTVAFVKTDSLGMEQAVRDYWIDEYTASQGIQLLQDASGNFYLLNVGGITDDCFSIIKLDSLGNFLTQKSYCGYLSSGEPCSFIRTADGGL